MNRLTKEWTKLPPELIQKCLIKLSQLEDIEEELGIDLITLFKALKNGIYVKDDDYGIVFIKNVYIGDDYIIDGVNSYLYFYKDYGKKWSLVKEELE